MDATDPTVTWSTSNSSVATVNNGTIVAVGTGTCTITAKAGSKTEKITVTVVKLTYEEKLLKGTWYADGYLDEYGDYKTLPSGSTSFYAYDDNTGKMTVSTSTLTFTWEYVKQDGDSYFFKLKTTDGSTCNALISPMDGENTLVVELGSLYVLFEK